jgi:glycosyltransferase involved in cell wall biosynthesis
MRMAGLKWYEKSKHNERTRRKYEIAFNAVDSINYNTPGLAEICHAKSQEIRFDLQPRDEFIADIGASVGPATPVARGRPHKEALEIVVATRFSSYQKRHDILIDALRLLPKEVDFNVVMIGTGPERSNIERRIRDYCLSDRVEIQPFLPQAQLWNVLTNADLLCHPCEYEGLSKIIIESMMLGLPVLASDVAPIPDYIDDGSTGFLVGNVPEDWAEKLTFIYNNQDKLNVVSRAALEFSRSTYSIERNVGNYERNFLRLCDNGRIREATEPLDETPG